MEDITLKEALERIKQLENEIVELTAENKRLLNRQHGGRKKHDETWTASYNDFIIKYENGIKLKDIVAEGNISRRTAYRYLAYYKKIQKNIDE